MKQESNPKYPRDLAIRVLTRVLGQHEPLDEVLAAMTGEIPVATRGWLQEVCSGTLRWKGRLDLALDAAAIKKKPSGWLRRALLLACYQLIAQDRTSPGAVVSETVSLIKKKEGEAPARFANACLRKVAAQAAEWRASPMPQPPESEEAAQWASLPTWIWRRIVRQRGAAWAEAYARTSLERPLTWVRARREDWKPEWAEAGPLAKAWRVSVAGAIPDKEGFGEGEFIVQDISSQLLIEEVSRAVKALGGGSLRALDLCAAPGGKSVGLAWNGVRVSATDRDDVRVALLRQTVERTAHGGAEIRILPRQEIGALDPQDLVWVDAPCTGSGILRRHPDVRWVREEKELVSLNRTQLALLQEAWTKVRPGGLLAYSVCSVLDEEGPEVIRRAGLATEIQKEWRLSPQDAPGGDGFWGALLAKPV